MVTPATNEGGRGIPASALGVVSFVVIACAVGASFRMGFGEGFAANAARAGLAGAAGGLLALAGALRRLRGAEESPGFELTIYGASTSAAAGVALSAALLPLPMGLVVGPFAVIGAALAVGAVRLVDGRSRLANLGAGMLLAIFIALAALAGSFGLQQGGLSAAAIAWLLGDFSTATAASSCVAIAVLLGLWGLAARGCAGDEIDAARLERLGPVAMGFGFGLAGVLGFVGSFVPRTVRVLAPCATPRAFIAASVCAGAASVMAIDAVGRLLIGGYALPFAVSTGMLAVPIYLGWNRRRLRREVGGLNPIVEGVEVVAIALGTAVALALAVFLTQIVRGAT